MKKKTDKTNDQKATIVKRILYAIVKVFEQKLPSGLLPHDVSSPLLAIADAHEMTVLFSRIRKGLVRDPQEEFHNQAAHFSFPHSTGYRKLHYLLLNEWLPEGGVRTQCQLTDMLEKMVVHDCERCLSQDGTARCSSFFSSVEFLVQESPALGKAWIAVFGELLYELMSNELRY